MRINIRFRKKDPDLCKWRHSIDGRMISFYINNILSAELKNRIAYIPQTVLLSMDDTPCEVNFRVQSEEIESFILSIPYRQRNAVIKEIIRKHLRAQADIKVKTTNPFAKDFQMTPPQDTSGIIPSEYVFVPVKQTVAKAEKTVEPRMKEDPAIALQPKAEREPTSTPQQEAREETDEEREMRMALIAMAGE